jgi:hypothetical protein
MRGSTLKRICVSGARSATTKRERAMSRDLSWSELAELTHVTQVEHFSFCLCEDNEGQENPYADCPKGDENE